MTKPKVNTVIQTILGFCVNSDGSFDRKALGELVSALAIFVDDRIEQSVISGAMDEYSIAAARGAFSVDAVIPSRQRLRQLAKLLVGVLDWTIGGNNRDDQHLLIDMVVDELIKRDRGDSDVSLFFDEETTTIVARAGTALMGLAKVREETEDAVNRVMTTEPVDD